MAKTNAEKQEDYRARKRRLGLVQYQGFCHPAEKIMIDGFVNNVKEQKFRAAYLEFIKEYFKDES